MFLKMLQCDLMYLMIEGRTLTDYLLWISTLTDVELASIRERAEADAELLLQGTCHDLGSEGVVS